MLGLLVLLLVVIITMYVILDRRFAGLWGVVGLRDVVSRHVVCNPRVSFGVRCRLNNLQCNHIPAPVLPLVLLNAANLMVVEDGVDQVR